MNVLELPKQVSKRKSRPPEEIGDAIAGLLMNWFHAVHIYFQYTSETSPYENCKDVSRQGFQLVEKGQAILNVFDHFEIGFSDKPDMLSREDVEATIRTLKSQADIFQNPPKESEIDEILAVI